MTEINLKLSATMRLCLESIEQSPGELAKKLPGGTQTVMALMARHLCEIQGEEWRVYLPAHKHGFQTTMHADGCHFYTTHARCECGVFYRFLGERGIKTDPWSAVWYDESDECRRCVELRDGARPHYEIVIARPDIYEPPSEYEEPEAVAR